jgi:hypothetical protein
MSNCDCCQTNTEEKSLQIREIKDVDSGDIIAVAFVCNSCNNYYSDEELLEKIS